MHRIFFLTAAGTFAALVSISAAAETTLAQSPIDSAALRRGVEQLRSTVGRWNVTTEFLNVHGSVARTTDGWYEFVWVVPDRVLSGRSEVPAQRLASGILFYVSPQKGIIEMVSVGADGNLWIMSGPLGGEVRETPSFATQGGGASRLRFTRYDIAPDSFRSRMEYTSDAGTTWVPGNRQVFRRAATTPKP